MKTNWLRLGLWCIAGACGGLLLSRENIPVAPVVDSDSSIVPMGITAALMQRERGALLLDGRAALPDDLLIPGALRFDDSTPRSSQRAIVIGDAKVIERAARKFRVVGSVAPWTLQRETHLPAAWEISTAQLQQQMKRAQREELQVIDLREEHEFRASRIPHSERVSMFEVAARIDKTRPVLLFCETGHRSAFVVRNLRARGYRKAWSVRGGWFDWKHQKRPLEGEAEL